MGGGPHRAVQRRLDALLDDAERRHTLAHATRGDIEAFNRRARKGHICTPARHLYARSSYWDGLSPREQALHVIRAEAARHPRWAFRSTSAALVWGIDVPYPLIGSPCAIAGRIHQLDGYDLREPSPFDHIEHCHGIPVTSFWDTVMECLRGTPFSYGLAIADSALRLTGGMRDDLLERLAEAPRQTGIQQAHFIASYADGRAENGGESRVRAYLIARGYLTPDLQVELSNPVDPLDTFRVDFYWAVSEEQHVAGEFDGMLKYQDARLLGKNTTIGALVAERQRESRLTLLGLPVLRFTYEDLIHPVRLDRLLHAAHIPQDLDAARTWRERWNAVARTS